MDTEKKYLDSKSLAALIGKIKSKVETITNQLDNKKATKDELASAESRITAAEKDIDAAEVLLQSISSKLGGISSGAEVNQNAFSNVKVGSTTVAADAKQDTLELVAGTNVTISADAATDKISISAKDTTYNEATTSAAGLMSATDKTNLNSAVSKLSGISSGAEVNQNAFSNVKVGSTTVAADAKQDTLELVAGTNITIDADVANDKISISTTAEVNQNAFSNVKVGSTTVAADAKQDTLELVAGTNVTISADAATDKISISAKDTTYSAATTSAAGLMSATDKTNLNNVVNKLSGIASGAEVNQNAFSNVKVGSTTVAADAKQDTLELVQGSAIVLGADVANDKISISHDKEGPASGYTSGNTTTSISGSGGSGTIKIPQLTVDKYGHVTSAADENVTIAIPTIPTALKNPKALKFGSKTYDGSVEAEITAADLGLSSALKYHGTTTTAISDGATTNPIVIGGSNHTATQGCVVAYGKKEFVWTGSVWEELGNEGNYKVIQTAVSSPSASGSTTAFIDTISQDTNGKITVTKKNVSFPSLASYVTGPGSSTANHVAVFKDTTGKVIKDSGFTIGKSVPSDAVFTDRSVTSVSYHYTPAEDTNSAISASGGSATNITGTGGKLNVVTGLKRDAKGHIVGVTSANIYSTDNNTDTNHYPTAFAWTNGTTAGPTGSLTGSGMSAVSFGAIPSASATTSGVVTTGAQTFAGSKTFTDNINLFANDNDRFINFKSTPNDIDLYSWRIGYLGTGFGDDNALTFQTSKTGAWVDALKFTLPGDATFSQSVTATKFITKNGTSSQVVKGDGSLENENSLSVASAGKLTTPRTISLTGAASGSVSFDGSKDVSIPVTTIYEDKLAWSTTNVIDGTIVDNIMRQARMNVLSFMPASAITAEYSNDGGATWIDYGMTNAQKVALVTPILPNYKSLFVGNTETDFTIQNRTRIIINLVNANVYARMRKLFLDFIYDNPSVYIDVYYEIYDDYNTGTWSVLVSDVERQKGDQSIAIPNSLSYMGCQLSGNYPARLKIEIYRKDTGTGRVALSHIEMLASEVSKANDFVKNGSPMTVDWQQNVTFPAKVTATTLSGSLDASNLTGTVAKARLGAHSHAYTPAGTIGSTTATGIVGNATAGGSVSSSFTGTAHNHGFTGTAHKHTFTGTAHKHTFTGTATTSGGPSGTTSVYSITGVGSLPSCTLPSTTVSYSNGELSITHNVGSFSAGSLPSRSEVTVASSNHTHSVTATGTIGNTTAGGSLNEVAATGTIGNTTAGGSVSSTFTGTAHNHSFTGTAHNHSFTGTAGTATTIS